MQFLFVFSNHLFLYLYYKGLSRVFWLTTLQKLRVVILKDTVPDMELEAFCHGAMCIAYAGRCLMSAYLTGRSAQSGFCSHTCRWNFKVSGAASVEQAKALAQSGLLRLTTLQKLRVVILKIRYSVTIETQKYHHFLLIFSN